jgi:hypothetical protein
MRTLYRVKAGENFLNEVPKDNLFLKIIYINNKPENQMRDQRKYFLSLALI